MRPFYQVATYLINNWERNEEFLKNRYTWYSEKNAIICSVTTIHHESSKTFHAEVNIYQRGTKQRPHTERVA